MRNTTSIACLILVHLIGIWLMILPAAWGSEIVKAPFVVTIPDSPYPEYILTRNLVREMCDRLSIHLQILSLPPARSIIEVNKGTYDADGPRNRSVEKNYPLNSA